MNAHKVAAGIIALGLILGSAPAAHAGWLQLLEGLVKGGGRAAGTIADEGSTVAREAGATERAAGAVVGPLLRILTGGMLLTFLGIARSRSGISMAGCGSCAAFSDAGWLLRQSTQFPLPTRPPLRDEPNGAAAN